MEICAGALVCPLNVMVRVAEPGGMSLDSRAITPVGLAELTTAAEPAG